LSPPGGADGGGEAGGGGGGGSSPHVFAVRAAAAREQMRLEAEGVAREIGAAEAEAAALGAMLRQVQGQAAEAAAAAAAAAALRPGGDGGASGSSSSAAGGPEPGSGRPSLTPTTPLSADDQQADALW